RTTYAIYTRLYFRCVLFRSARPVDRALEPDDDLVDLVLRHDERGREQHMVAAAPVDGASHRIAKQSVLHGDALERRMQLQRRIEGLPGVPVLHELQADEQAAAPDVADVRMVAQRIAQARHQPLPSIPYLRQQPVPFDDSLDGQRSRAGY